MPTTSTIKERINFNAFDKTVTDADIAAYRASGGKNPGSGWIVLIVFLALFSAAFFIGFIVSLVGEYLRGSVSPADLREASHLAYAAVFLSVPIIPVYFLNKRASRAAMTRNVQMKEFIEANGWDFDESPNTPERPGMLFNEGEERMGYYTVTSDGGRDFTFGHYSYVTGVGRGRSNNHWGFIEIPLETKLPHIVLDAKNNNGRLMSAQLYTTLPKAFGSDKRVSVSGEVDELYVTYTSSETTNIAEYFTADFINELKTIPGNYDFEMIENKLYAYSLTPFAPIKADMERALAVIDLLKRTFSNATVEAHPSDAATLSNEATAPLNSWTPKLVRTLGFIGITVQIIVAFGLLFSDK